MLLTFQPTRTLKISQYQIAPTLAKTNKDE